MLKKVLFICLLFYLPGAIARGDFFIKVQNKTNYDAVITLDNGNNQEWDCEDFCTPQAVLANSNKEFKSHTTTFSNLIDKYSGIETINISYGDTLAKVQFWIDHLHRDTDVMVKTAIVYEYRKNDFFKKHCSYFVMVGVGTSNENIKTDLYVENIGDGIGETHVTLVLT